MLFNSYPFLLGFLPLTVLAFFGLARVSHKFAANFLGAASLVFYGYWNITYTALLLVSIAFNFAIGRAIERQLAQALSSEGVSTVSNYQSGAARILAAGIITNLALLCYFKYMDFFIGSINALSDNAWLPLLNITLPLGISFFTFTQIAYLVDVRRGVACEYNFSHYLLFVTYFPHLIAGPVLHHRQMMPQFSHPNTYQPQWNLIAQGIAIFSVGLAKKLLLADPLGTYASPVFAAAAHGEQPNFWEAWTGTLGYSLQLYFDFSGYSDMAVGLSLIFGVRLPINFNSPYKALNIIDFWRRWHITLSTFLKDYLYIPIGGNRSGKARRHLNLMITMLLGGLWHGANWTFVIWGGLHGVFLVINHAWRHVAVRLLIPPIPPFAARLLTFLSVCLAWVFFRSEDLPSALRILEACAGLHGIPIPQRWLTSPELLKSALLTVASGGIFSISALAAMNSGTILKTIFVALVIAKLTPNTQEWMGFPDKAPRQIHLHRIHYSWKPTVLSGTVFGVAFCYLLSLLQRVSTFLYYQF